MGEKKENRKIKGSIKKYGQCCHTARYCFNVYHNLYLWVYQEIFLMSNKL